MYDDLIDTTAVTFSSRASEGKFMSNLYENLLKTADEHGLPLKHPNAIPSVWGEHDVRRAVLITFFVSFFVSLGFGLLAGFFWRKSRYKKPDADLIIQDDKRVKTAELFP